MRTKRYIVPVFVPHQGCPHDCIFCNQRKITGQIKDVSLEEVEEMIDEYLAEIHSNSIDKYVEIAFYGGSFTGIDYSLQEAYLKIAYKKKSAGLIDGIRLSTRPDYIDEKIIDLLKRYGVSCVEIGVQSLDESVLVSANRGHTINDVVRACNLVKAAGFELGLQMMIGLPGDKGNSSYETADRIISLKPDFVRIYPTLVVKDTQLELLYKSNLYQPLTVDEAAIISVNLYKKFSNANITVIRIGLQPTDDLSNGTSLEAGPYHPAFRQLVEGKLYKDKIDEILDEYDVITSIKIYISAKEISNIVGMNRVNLNYFEKKYKIKKISVFPEFMEDDIFKLVINDEIIQVNKF